jgi:hypothetical protein
MNQILKGVLLILSISLLVARPNIGIAEKSELLNTICFPKDETTPQKDESCKDEDCGLTDVINEPPTPTAAKRHHYTLLGATDYGMMWGPNNYRVIGDGRVRVLLYVIPSVTTKVTYYDKGNTSIPYRVIQSTFFSSYDKYESSSISVSSSVSVSYAKVKKEVERKKEVIGGKGVLQMVDLHCSARKIKIYDNNTLYYRIAERQSKENLCVELLWEKPEAPLEWQPASSLTMDILTGYYCKVKK